MTPMLGALFGTLLVFAFNLLTLSALVGLGVTLRRAFGLKVMRLDDWFFAAWMGFGVVLLFLILWNLVMPVGPAAFAVVVGTGCAALFGWRHSLWAAVRVPDIPRWSVIGALIFGLWVANLSLAPSLGWDTALYHMQAVRWALEYRTPPGLANIFGPLGFNNSNLLYDAMLSVGPFSGRSWHVANGALLWLFASQSLISIGVVHRTTAGKAPHAVFASMLLPFAVAAIGRQSASSFTTVVPAGLVVLVAATIAFRVVCDSQRSGHERAYDYVCIAALAAVSVSIKLSMAVFAAATVALTVAALLRGDAAVAHWRARALTWTVAAVLSIGLAWAARGVILSGYPLFPSSFLHLPVDWSVPAEHARAELAFVQHSARATASNVAYVSGEVAGLGAWIPNWLTTVWARPFEIVVPLTLTLLAGAALVVAPASSRESRSAERQAWWLLPPIAVALVAWFLIAPMPHYAASFFWALAALVATQAVRAAAPDAGRSRTLGNLALALGLAPCLVIPLQSSENTPAVGDELLAVLRANAVIPERGRWHKPTPAWPPVREFITQSGLALNTPSGSGAPRCWFAPLPCTPNPATNLRLRQPDRIKSGFTVDGVWLMQNWPQPWRPELLPALRRYWEQNPAAGLAR